MLSVLARVSGSLWLRSAAEMGMDANGNEIKSGYDGLDTSARSEEFVPEWARIYCNGYGLNCLPIIHASEACMHGRIARKSYH